MVLLMLALMLATAASSAGLDSSSQLTQVSAVEGKTAELPCDITPPHPGDELRLVLWYYGSGGTPIYTYDSRNKNSALGAHWVDPGLDRRRVHFQPDASPAHLRVTGVQRADQRLYRCRVDFLHSPTRNSRVNLTIIVPTGIPIVVDNSGQELARGGTASFREGQMLQMTCKSTGGWPTANVTWWRDGDLVDGSWEPDGAGAVTNQLTAGPLTRADLGSQYTCTAHNHALTQPRSARVTVDMILRPLTVSILGTNNPLSAGVTYSLTCQSTGSRPTATITWWLGGQKLKLTNQTSSHDGNVTTSKVRLTPRVQDSDQIIRCLASSPLLSNTIEDMWRLKVRYPPQVQLRLTRPLKGSIIEGDRVSMECLVNANPPPLRVVWKRNGTPLVSDPRRDLVLNSRSLTLHNIRRESSGDYYCEAANDEGSGTSRPVSVTVQYPPVCDPGHVTSIAVSRGETANVTCRVKSEPAPFRFVWAFNTTTGHLIELPESSWVSSGDSSTCRYTPQTELDYGDLLCWAENDLGTQMEPCVFSIVQAERPEVVSNCTVTEAAARSARLRCVPGRDGGLRQTFWAEVRRDGADAGRLVANVSSDRPRFTLGGLRPGGRYKVTVYAANGKGSSDRLITYLETTQEVAQGITAPDAERGQPTFQVTPILAVLIGIVAVLAVTAAVVGIGMRLCSRSSSKKSCPSVTQLSSTGVNGSASTDLNLKGKQSNPDIVPNEYLDPEEKHMIERLNNPTPRTVLCQSKDGSRGYYSPKNTIGSMDRSHLYSRRPEKDMRADGQYTSVPCLAQRPAECGGPGAAAPEEAAPLLPPPEYAAYPAQHRESSDSSEMESFMFRTPFSTSQETVIHVAEPRLSTQF